MKQKKKKKARVGKETEEEEACVRLQACLGVCELGGHLRLDPSRWSPTDTCPPHAYFTKNTSRHTYDTAGTALLLGGLSAGGGSAAGATTSISARVARAAAGRAAAEKCLRKSGKSRSAAVARTQVSTCARKTKKTQRRRAGGERRFRGCRKLA